MAQQSLKIGSDSAGDSNTKGNRNRMKCVDEYVDTEPKGLRTFTPSLAVIAKSAGCYHWTPEGRKLADFTSGVLVANLGHNPLRWWQRVWEYLQLPEPGRRSSGDFVPMLPLTSYNATTQLEAQCCERLVANMRAQPGGGRMQQVMWAASGSEAIQKVLVVRTAPHARPRHDTVHPPGLSRQEGAGQRGHRLRVRPRSRSARPIPVISDRRVPRCASPSPANRLDARIEQELESVAEELGDRVGCLITEPYLGGGGSYHPQPEYLQLLERFCRERDIIFILDEIQSNFGRTGPMYAYTHYGIEPDIVCLGKGLGNGVPVSAAVGRADVLETLDYGYGSDTWSANPLASAAVLATLDEFETTNVLEQGRALSAVLEEGLGTLETHGGGGEHSRRRVRVGDRVPRGGSPYRSRRCQCVRPHVLSGRPPGTGRAPPGPLGRQGPAHQPAAGDARRRSTRVTSTRCTICSTNWQKSGDDLKHGSRDTNA